MRKLSLSRQFKKDWSKLKSSGIKNFDDIKDSLDFAQKNLRLGNNLPENYQDHPLKNDPGGKRDCHITGSIVLIYKLTDETLTLYRINTHSEIFE
jgi:mRNA interferase YafQ